MTSLLKTLALVYKHRGCNLFAACFYDHVITNYFDIVPLRCKYASERMLKVHQDIIISNLPVLVEKTNLDELVPELLHRNVFNEQMINRILNPYHPAKRQKTDLYVELLQRGPLAFEQLQDALMCTNHSNLAQILQAMDLQESSQIHRSISLNSIGSTRSLNSSGNESDGPCQSIRRKSSGQLGPPKRPGNFSEAFPKFPNSSSSRSQGSSKKEQKKTSDLKDFSRENSQDPTKRIFNLPAYSIDILDEDLRATGTLTPDDKVIYTIEKNRPVEVKCATQFQSQTKGRPRIYKMDSDPRGYALLVNNVVFHNSEEYPDRVGSENDVTRLKQLLTQLHFVVEAYENKTKREMEEIVDRFSQKPELEYADCAWIIFMSHGQEGESYEDSEIIGVDGMGYKTDDIVSRFYNDSCKALIDKPKIFFFQACRGGLTDPGVVVGKIYNLSLSHRITTDGRQVKLPTKNVKVRTRSDIFIVYPTPPGLMANRDRITGAWFIQTVVDVFCEHAWNTHLEDLLKMVDEKIKGVNNFHPSNFQAVTTKSIGWSKHLFFHPGLSRDKNSGEIVYMGNHQPDEGMDVVDASSSNSDQSPNGTTYSRLKDMKDDDSSDETKSDCFNISGCKPS